ncbi:hypothetical protein BK129_14615 [Paenibacillus amylolyticus]|nr:hypothetical protein BK129_14615 [Paenibacillus amylolyticus]
MQIRIKASDEFEDRFALSLSGGQYKDSPYPMFVFQNEMQRNRYDQIRRQRKEENGDVSNQKGNPEARTVSRKYRSSREFRI